MTLGLGFVRLGAVQPRAEDTPYLKIFFDVDQTLLHSSPEGWELRPGSRDVLEALTEMGHEVYLWTATGAMHARQLVERYDLQKFVVDCFDKDPTAVPMLPDIVVDDDWFLVQKYNGVLVSQYRETDPDDRELYRVLDWFRNLPQ